MRVDPARYRQTLLDSLTDDGLEELTLRLARPKHPDAHRAGKGKDGGIDVLSDFDLPPARAWQCKNHKSIDWNDCRDSLRQAMSDEHPPRHYTFVFPRPLTGPQRDFWRKTFLPEQRCLYPDLDTLNVCDNLAERLDDHPELLDQLNEGAFSSAYRTVATAAAQTGVNPLASIADLVGDAPQLAQRAVETGRTDPRYRYEHRQREARADDRTIPEGRMRFGFEAPIGRPREFTATVRAGDAVQEKAAGPREGIALEQITLWFSNTAAGASHREHVRSELAAARPVDLVSTGGVGLDARPIPDRFAELTDHDGVLRSGEAHIGLSDPLALEVWLETKDGRTPTAELALYRIPSEPGYSISYGGSFHGALLFLDINPEAARPDGQPGNWSDTSIAVGIDAGGVPATELVTGLGFALTFGRTTRLHLDCQGLLPDDGMALDITDQGVDDETREILEHAVIVTTALAELTALDARPRYLTPSGTQRDVAVAELVHELLQHGEVRQPLTAPYRYSVPDVRRPLGQLGGQPTVVAELRIEGQAEGRLIRVDGRTVIEAVPLDGDAEIALALVGPVA
jgi:hypothetical protein